MSTKLCMQQKQTMCWLERVKTVIILVPSSSITCQKSFRTIGHQTHNKPQNTASDRECFQSHWLLLDVRCFGTQKRVKNFNPRVKIRLKVTVVSMSRPDSWSWSILCLYGFCWEYDFELMDERFNNCCLLSQWIKLDLLLASVYYHDKTIARMTIEGMTIAHMEDGALFSKLLADWAIKISLPLLIDRLFCKTCFLSFLIT